MIHLLVAQFPADMAKPKIDLGEIINPLDAGAGSTSGDIVGDMESLVGMDATEPSARGTLHQMVATLYFMIIGMEPQLTMKP